jgi:hypothetical protein
VKTIEDVKRLGTFLANDFQIGFRHIGADERDLRSQFIADDSEESLKGFDGSFAAHPKQARDAVAQELDSSASRNGALRRDDYTSKWITSEPPKSSELR